MALIKTVNPVLIISIMKSFEKRRIGLLIVLFSIGLDLFAQDTLLLKPTDLGSVISFEESIKSKSYCNQQFPIF